MSILFLKDLHDASLPSLGFLSDNFFLTKPLQFHKKNLCIARVIYSFRLRSESVLSLPYEISSVCFPIIQLFIPPMSFTNFLLYLTSIIYPVHRIKHTMINFMALVSFIKRNHQKSQCHQYVGSVTMAK